MISPKSSKFQKPSTSTKNLLEAAAANGKFTYFTRAVEQAGLSETLRGPGPFTVFAPTDSAFEKLPSGAFDKLMKDENRQELISILNYHVMTGRKTAAGIGHWDSARTVHGQAATIRMTGSQVSIDGAQVTAADIDSSNGMIHGIDQVIMPAPIPR